MPWKWYWRSGKNRVLIDVYKRQAVCCKQKYATGVYTSGVVFEPRFYEGLADMLKKDELRCV